MNVWGLTFISFFMFDGEVGFNIWCGKVFVSLASVRLMF